LFKALLAYGATSRTIKLRQPTINKPLRIPAPNQHNAGAGARMSASGQLVGLFIVNHYSRASTKSPPRYSVTEKSPCRRRSAGATAQPQRRTSRAYTGRSGAVTGAGHLRRDGIRTRETFPSVPLLGGAATLRRPLASGVIRRWGPSRNKLPASVALLRWVFS
jgi:hypothetical protein